MGIFFKKNRYDISPDIKKINSVVTKLDERVIKINAKLNVPDDYFFVIGKKGKVLDLFEHGEYFFAYSNLPYICRRYGIDKIIDGRQQDTIEADMYLVDSQLRGLDFKTYRRVEMGTRAYGIFKAHVFGMYSYRVVNAKEFMQSLLNEFDYIKSCEAEDILTSWVEEVIVDELEKQNFIINDVIINDPKITNALVARLQKLFKTIGLELVELKITKYKLPKKYQAESDAIMGKEKDDNQNQQKTEEEQDKQNDNANEENETSYVPFGNIKIETYDNSISTKQQKEFVDLSLGVTNNGDEKTKRCLNCGTENNMEADHCVICGEKFNNEEI